MKGRVILSGKEEMKRSEWLVGSEGIRLAGKQDECFYCQEKEGTPHKEDCVIRQRTIMCRLAVEFPVSIVESWTPESWEFFANGNTHCAANELESLMKLLSKIDGDDWPCLCGNLSYVREATEEDEQYWGLRVADLPG